MSDIPSELKYTDTHEWIREYEDSVYSVGITDHAQSMLGDLVFVELPEVGAIVNQGDEIAVIESVKAAADIYVPISGEIIATNQPIVDNAAVVNSEPYESGWLFQIKANNLEEVDALLSADAYSALIED